MKDFLPELSIIQGQTDNFDTVFSGGRNKAVALIFLNESETLLLWKTFKLGLPADVAALFLALSQSKQRRASTRSANREPNHEAAAFTTARDDICAAHPDKRRTAGDIRRYLRRRTRNYANG